MYDVALTFAEALAAAQTKLNQTMGRNCLVHIHHTLNDSLIQTILQVDAQKFRNELQYRREEVFEHGTMPGFILFLADCNGVPLGIVYGYDDQKAGGFFLDTLASMFEGKGVGHILASLIAIHAYQQGHLSVNLYTEERDEMGRQLRKFYEKMGYKYLGTEEGKGDIMKMELDPEIIFKIYGKYLSTIPPILSNSNPFLVTDKHGST